ncbi:MAG TPA: hypothetical protein VMM77_12140 [Gemmatimonadaceae bacterium]|nr:hypothetical protein [Gemmatimonadaceae bacterium]
MSIEASEQADHASIATSGAAIITRQRAVRIVFVLVAGSLPALLLREAVAAAAALHPAASSSVLSFGLAEAVTVYLTAPLAALSACILFISPGLLLALAANTADTIGSWMLKGFAISLALLATVAAVAHGVGSSPDGIFFGLLVLGCTLAAGGAVIARVSRGASLAWPLGGSGATAAMVSTLVVPAAILLAFAPKFFWEDLNGDGAHAFEAARLLLFRAVPFWDAAAGEVAGFPGLTSMLYAYPASWFIRLFGPVEVSARLPMLLYLATLFGGLHALIALRRPAPRAAESWLLWLALAVYFVTVSFSATYAPYAADIALPATQDSLLIACFLGFVLAFERGGTGWMLAFALLTHISLPNGILLIGFWVVAVILTRRPLPRRELAMTIAALAACVLLGVLAPPILAAFGQPEPGGEYGLGGLVRRFAFLQLTDLRRFLFLAVPCGILPAIALFGWRRQDALAQALTLTTAAAFLFAYVQLHASLHYYIPAMLLPLVVYWRLDVMHSNRRRQMLVATAAAAIVSLVIAMPAEPGPVNVTRNVGYAIDFRVPGYHSMAPESFRASTLLIAVVPYDWDPRVPEATLGTSPLVLSYYANRRPSGAETNYVLQRTEDPPVVGATLLSSDGEFAVYVLADSIHRRHLALRPPTPAGARAFVIPRGILFRTEPLPDSPYVIDLPAIAERLGIDVDALAARMGVVR